MKKDKLIKFMIMIKSTMEKLYISAEYKNAENENLENKKRNFNEEYNKDNKRINLRKEDDIKFDDIVFRSKFFFK